MCEKKCENQNFLVAKESEKQETVVKGPIGMEKQNLPGQMEAATTEKTDAANKWVIWTVCVVNLMLIIILFLKSKKALKKSKKRVTEQLEKTRRTMVELNLVSCCRDESEKEGSDECKVGSFKMQRCRGIPPYRFLTRPKTYEKTDKTRKNSIFGFFGHAPAKKLDLTSER